MIQRSASAGRSGPPTRSRRVAAPRLRLRSRYPPASEALYIFQCFALIRGWERETSLLWWTILKNPLIKSDAYPNEVVEKMSNVQCDWFVIVEDSFLLKLMDNE